jgi:Cdc6-like AAA superfamily ATPase
MAQDTLQALTSLPRRLLFREKQLEDVLMLLKEGSSFAVRGSFGTGKTTLIRMALSRTMLSHVFIECMYCRTSQCIRRRVDPRVLNVLDDYSLARRTPELVFLVAGLPRKILVVHPGFAGEELGGMKIIEMPPYTKEEIERILVERVVELGLRVSDEQVEACAYKGYRAGGNVRVALLCLAGYL